MPKPFYSFILVAIINFASNAGSTETQASIKSCRVATTNRYRECRFLAKEYATKKDCLKRVNKNFKNLKECTDFVKDFTKEHPFITSISMQFAFVKYEQPNE